MPEQFVSIFQIIFADIILSGDNALVIGMAAASLSPVLRKKAIFLGMALAAVLRIIFAAMATYLIEIPGILFFGGLLLAWVCFRFYNELRAHITADAEKALTAEGYQGSPRRQLFSALVTITIADFSMSIDNVIAVAAIARDDTALLVFGLVLAIAFMAFFATIIMNLMTRFPLLSYAGLVFLILLTLEMLHDGWPEVAIMIGFN
ncbi:MAG: YjbE family putative metal transport protein [Rhizobiaceae bacterium]|nr:YjbE family putative metal transport protein [Rhizobiaceae bacterium]